MSERRRLVLLAAYGGPYEGSFVPMARALGEEVLRRGWEAELCFSPEAEGRPWLERLREGTAASVTIAPPGGRGETARWLAEKLGDGAPALLHTHFTRYDLPAAWLRRRRPGTAVVWHVHTPPYGDPRSRLRNAVKFGLLGRSVDAILASGPDPARGVRRAGAPGRLVRVVGGGVDTDRFPIAGEAERRAWRERLGLPEHARVLLHFGWDWALKDGDLFLATVRAAAERDDRFLGLTVSDSPAAGAAVEREGLSGAVRVLDPRDEVHGLYAAADVFVSSSRVEGQPFAVIEALCSGLPVVATDLPGHRDIGEGVASCRVAPRSPEALAAAAAELLERPAAEAAGEAASARERLVARFGLGPWAERIADVYDGCPGKR